MPLADQSTSLCISWALLGNNYSLLTLQQRLLVIYNLH